MHLHISPTPTEAIEKLADYFIAICNESIATHNRFSVALSGGSSPKKLFELLATDDYKNKTDWSKVYFFFGDERYVPHTDKDSNYLMAQQALLLPLQINAEQVFPVNTSLSQEAAAQDYEDKLNRFFDNKTIALDLVLLGLGDNAHTASLFPHTDILNDAEPAVKAVFVKEVNAYRITLNAPLINNARRIAFLVFGKGKAEAVQQILRQQKDVAQYPAQLIKTDETVDWFMDEDAADLI